MTFGAQPIKKVGLRELNRNMYKYIKTEEPFLLTKDKKPYLMVIPYAQAMELLAKATRPQQNEQPTLGAPARSSFSEDYTDSNGQPNKTFWQRVKETLHL